MDAFHGTVGYFKMVTVINTRESKNVMIFFLEGSRKETGKLQFRAFMSDCAKQYFNAWASVMVDNGDNLPRKLICSLHVFEAFKANLSKIIGLPQRYDVFKELMTVMKILDVELFETVLKNFTKELDSNTDTKPKYLTPTRHWKPRIVLSNTITSKDVSSND